MGVICKEDAVHNHIPDYALSFDDDIIRFANRNTKKALPAAEVTLYPTLDPETYNDARIVAPGYDVYQLETQWRNYWVESGRPELKSADAAFIGFCKNRHARAPMRRSDADE